MNRAVWLALLTASAAGGWFSGRALQAFLVQRAVRTPASGIVEPSLSKTEPAFAANSPRGLWMERVKKAKAAHFPELNSEWETVFPYDARYDEGYPPNALNARRWMLGMWLVKDFDGFLNAASGESFGNAHWAAQAMVELMPEESAEMIFGPGREGRGGFFIGSIASALAEQQPVLYLKMNPEGTIDLTPDHNSTDDWLTAITNLAKTDAPAAGNASLRWNVENASGTLYNALLNVAKAWNASDPPISQWVNAVPDPKFRNLAIHAWLSALAEKDPETALTELYAANLQHSSALHEYAQAGILKQLAKARPVEALKLLKNLESDFLKHEYITGASDPFQKRTAEQKTADQADLNASPFGSLSSGNYASIDDVENTSARGAVLDAIADNLPHDPVGLVAGLRKLAGEAGLGDALWTSRVEKYLILKECGRWTVDECCSMVQILSSESVAAKDDGTLQKLATRAATVDPEAALAGLERFPESVRSFLVGEIIKQLPSSESQTRIALLKQIPAAQWDSWLGETLGRDGAEYAAIITSQPVETSREARRSFAGKWGEQDPKAVAGWLRTLPDDSGGESAAGGLASAWIRYDGDAATAWADALPSGPVRDAAAESISYWLSMGHSTEAWHWAEVISNPKTRAKAYDQIAIYWKKKVPEAFRTAHDKARAEVGKRPYQYPSQEELDPFE